MEKKIYKRASLIFCLSYFALFLIFYLPNYVIELSEDFVGAYLVARELIERIGDFLIPATAATVIFAVEYKSGIRKHALRALAFGACSAVYYIPYCYLYSLTLGFDSVESVCLSVLMSIADALISGMEIFLLVILASLFLRRSAKWQNDASDLPAYVTESRAFDTSHPATVGVMAISVTKLVFALITEIYDTVTYLIEDAGMYGTGEVIYIMVTYVLLLLSMILCQVICVGLKNRVLRAVTPAEDNL